MFLLNPLKSQDIVFFVVCGAIIVVIIAVWLLIPVFNKRQYKEQRDSLRQREAIFRSLSHTTTEPIVDDMKEETEEVDFIDNNKEDIE